MSQNPTVQKELIELALKYSGTERPLQKTAIKSLQIARSDFATEPVHSVYAPSLCLIVQGAKEAIVAGKVFRYSANDYLVASINVPVTSHVTEATAKKPYLCLVIEIDPAVIYEIIKDAPPAKEGKSGSGIFLDKVNPDLNEAALRLLRCLNSETDTQILAPMITREMIYRLLSSKYGETVRQLGIAGSQTQRIANVIELIRKDFAKPLPNESLAKAAGMSPSSFHHHFKLVTTMSPLQYQKQIRLQEARRLMTAQLTDAASAAFQVGYESPSQFSREYARLFGLPPISDIKRLRQA